MAKDSKKTTRCIGLLRGINVGGKNKIKMAELREVLADAGLGNVRTYIQSGNLIFDSSQDAPSLESLLKRSIQQEFGGRSRCLCER